VRYNGRVALTREEVEHIAHLALLNLTADEAARYREQLEAILDYAARLQGVDTSSIAPTTSVLAPRPVLRADEPRPSLAPDEALRQAPDRARGQFRVPPVFE
jgi:aspartyl-tRNA(Asn)/glutamyl-tRNA(Gln) amidotransferase subunit C